MHIVKDTLGADTMTSPVGVENVDVLQNSGVINSNESICKIINTNKHHKYGDTKISDDILVSDDNMIVTYDNDVPDNSKMMDDNGVEDDIEISSKNKVDNDIEKSNDISGGIQVIDAGTHNIEEVMEDTMDDCLVVVGGETSDGVYQVDNENSQQSQLVEVTEEGTGSESENSRGAMCVQKIEVPERKYTIAIELDGGIRVVDGNILSGTSNGQVESMSKKAEAVELACGSQDVEQNSEPTTTQVADEVEGQPHFTEDGGMYYIDEEGVYYYQAPGATEAIRVCNEPETNPEAEEITSDMNNYDSVTLVPNDNGEDVSYVLIVQQPDDDSQEGGSGEVVNDHDNNMNVYDFDENEDTGNGDPGEEVDDKSTITRVPMKKNHVVLQRHVCHYCNYTSSRRYLLSRHMKSHSEERPHKCNVCERGFKTLASLQNHVNTHTGRKPHNCKFCDSAFTTSGELVRHVRYRHTHEKPHKCKECDYASVELSKLKRHVRCHTGERPYQCPHCTYASPDTFKLKRHLRTHTGERPYVCDMCQMCFTQSNSLKAHKLIHNIAAKPVFACELCPTTCGRKTDLRIHVQKLHTSDKPLKCKRCGKSFPDRYTYKLHNKTHEGEKCFKCEMCPYASISQRHLASHMMIHTNEKPFACDECDQSFRQKQLLRRHQNLYHNPDYIPAPPKEKSHECRECRRQFRHKGNLIRHLAVHDPDSTVHEQNLALKLGRQKKIEYKYSLDSDDEGECEDEDLTELEEITMEDEDGMQAGSSLSHISLPVGENQQYVVLEVIELPVETDAHNVAPSSIFENGLLSSDINMDESDVLQPYEPEECEEDLDEEEEVMNVREQKFNRVKTAMDKGVDACFGFDEDDGEEEELLLHSKMEPKDQNAD